MHWNGVDGSEYVSYSFTESLKGSLAQTIIDSMSQFLYKSAVQPTCAVSFTKIKVIILKCSHLSLVHYKGFKLQHVHDLRVKDYSTSSRITVIPKLATNLI